MIEEFERIGILGLGEKSTQFYISKLNAIYSHINGGFSIYPFKLLNTDFNKINPYLPFEYDKFFPYLKSQIIELNKLGVSRILIPNITIHLSIDKNELPIDLYNKVIHPIKETIYHLKQNKIDKVTIIGSRHTSVSKDFLNYFIDEDIQITIPSESDVQKLDLIRLSVYEHGYNNAQRRNLIDIANKYKNPILCCTELSILNNDSFYLDMVDIQIKNSN